ncbi:ABC transporter ATP-binding protein [Chloroflexus sp.]|uniref:ABC transporter ATP-binding protein n=1 Tax=Chloroflexus sp. TaxID=1904827 RepID=UPI00298EE31C|nr:ABC transporter ATP-binding protein [Chloroflexus sp.]MCS6889182.1 ABC transporter ATP-binding protein [Chloroflexus sp.]MDW8403980.1 ABC transporter ATP-binding protein [Chloroflexus sp.]
MTNVVLSAENLSIGYPARRRQCRVIAKDLQLHLRRGEVVCLLGPNGAGKSTLLRTLTGMQPPLAGRIWLDGQDLSAFNARELARRMSVVLTERVEVGPLTAYALVALGRHPYTDWTGRLRPHDEAIVRWALEAVHAAHLARRMVYELSDGERQRIMVARALAQEPLVMVLDEPTAFLDLPRRVEIMQLLRRLAREARQAIILSTHDLELALNMADVLWLLTADGTFYCGAPEDLVLKGVLETIFADTGMVFDRMRGQFRMHQTMRRRANLTGDGLAKIWTARALERAGWQVVELPPAEAHVTIIGDNHQPSWELSVNGAPKQQFTSLYAVVHWLQQQCQEEEQHERHARATDCA